MAGPLACSQSEEGERCIERLLSASVTCRLQHRSLFAYLAELLTAHARGDTAPLFAEERGLDGYVFP